METLVINIKNKKDSRLIKELLSRLDVDVAENREQLRRKISRNKIKSKEDLLSFAGSMKGQLISKEHLRSLSWKKRS